MDEKIRFMMITYLRTRHDLPLVDNLTILNLHITYIVEIEREKIAKDYFALLNLKIMDNITRGDDLRSHLGFDTQYEVICV
jgi:hypothetical protein